MKKKTNYIFVWIIFLLGQTNLFQNKLHKDDREPLNKVSFILSKRASASAYNANNKQNSVINAFSFYNTLSLFKNQFSKLFGKLWSVSLIISSKTVLDECFAKATRDLLEFFKLSYKTILKSSCWKFLSKT